MNNVTWAKEEYHKIALVSETKALAIPAASKTIEDTNLEARGRSLRQEIHGFLSQEQQREELERAYQNTKAAEHTYRMMLDIHSLCVDEFNSLFLPLLGKL